MLTLNLASLIKGLIDKQVRYSSKPLFKSFNSTKHSPLFFHKILTIIKFNKYKFYTCLSVKHNHHF